MPFAKPSPVAVTPEGVAIWCHHDELCDPSTLPDYPGNPNTHSEDQCRRIVEIITANGWREAITRSRLTKRITKGHGRKAAAILAGWKAVPVAWQDYASEEDERRDVIADNRAREGAEIDEVALSAILDTIEDKSGAGFKASEIASLIENARPKTRIVKIDAGKPPTMTWIVIGITTTRYAEISTQIEELKGVAEFLQRSSNHHPCPTTKT